MPRYFLSYWKPEQAIDELERGELLNHSGSRQYGRVHVGDEVWIVTAWKGGHLALLGHLTVAIVTDLEGAADALEVSSKQLYALSPEDHIVAKLDLAEPIREVLIGHIADRLRFVSDRDRLQVVDERVSATQLQTMRELTPESADLLRLCWNQEGTAAEVVSTLVYERQHKGAGFGSSANNRQVEAAAIKKTMEHFAAEGWSIESVESKRIGFDLLLTRATESLHVEVKGVAGSVPDFIITDGELRRAFVDPKFVLSVVTNALLEGSILWTFHGKDLSEMFDVTPITHRARLLDG